MPGVDTAADGKRLVGKPVTVIAVNKQGKLILNSEALRSVLLQKDVRNLPVVVLSVAGAFRTGKSSILNVLLRFPFLQFKNWLGDPDKPLEGFPWMSGSDPHTEGIVFWSHLFRATTADKKKVAVLLVDTQGSFGTSASTTVSVHILALSVLISSIQVFNVMRNLQLDHLQHLQMYYKYGKHVQELEGGTSGFQLCVFLVRDWQWPKEYEYGWEGGERLLQKILGVESKNKATDELRDLRTYFESCLSSRNCFLMRPPRLTDDGCSLNGAVNGITPSFNEHLRDFVRGVLSPSTLVVKTLHGVPLTASELCKFVEHTYSFPVAWGDRSFGWSPLHHKTLTEQVTMVVAKTARKITPVFSSEELPELDLMVVKTDEYLAELAREKALMEYCYCIKQVFLSDGTLISPEELKQKEKNMRKKVLESFDNAARLKLNECKEKERETLTKELKTIFSAFWKSYQDVRKKYEESKKLQEDLMIAHESLCAIARAASSLADIMPAKAIPTAILAATTIAAHLAAVGTDVAAKVTDRKNKKDLADGARKLAADLEEKQS
ncbi:atlastin-3 isoform X1 [Ixodes scapularis]|uniref:atlastin-3 isoform X1 n=1 Tax=Ixodes scapularis TaxID=6945 RepID=UPI001A9D145A|nr:atlastin-3 isoform X1 [Ixodes scapularis]